MRHLHFTQSLEPLEGGGLGSSCVALHQQMLKQGIASVLCATYGKQPQNLVTASHEYPRTKPDFIYYSPAMHREAPRLAKEADVIHGHGLYVGTNFIFGREGRRQNKPLVYHVHGMFEPYILSRSKWKKRFVHALFENANFQHCRLWRALTAKEAEQIRACGISKPIVIAPNGLNLLDFSQPTDSVAELVLSPETTLVKRSPRLLFLGRIHPKKGLDLLISAWARLSRIAQNWQLVIAGPDESGHLNQIRNQAASLGILDQIFFTGPIKGQNKVRLLYSSDLFVLPSYSEGFSMSILEAMACGLSVIATRACNFPEISQKQAGWECDSTVESLAKTLEQALTASDSERTQRGQNGLRLVSTNYSWTSVIQTIQEACTSHC